MERGKVSGVGAEIKRLMDKNNITVKELSEKSTISEKIINGIINLEIEPYATPEMQRIMFVMMNKNNKEEIIQIVNNWVKRSVEYE